MLDIDPSSSACARCSIDLDDLIGKAEEALEEKNESLKHYPST